MPDDTASEMPSFDAAEFADWTHKGLIAESHAVDIRTPGTGYGAQERVGFMKGVFDRGRSRRIEMSWL